MSITKEERILFVDDDKMLRELAKKILTREGYEVQTASNGADAVNYLRKLPFNTVVTDIHMPIMSGDELLTIIKSDYPETEVIIITTFPTIDTAVSTMKLGAYDYIIKPINFDLLLTTIAKVNERKKLLNELKNEKQLRETIMSLFESTQDLFISTIKSLAEVIEAKDAYTYGHCERIRDNSLLIGKTFNFSTDEMRDLEYAALLHDVGKIAIPEAILNKPGILNETESEIFKTHTTKGVSILSHIKQLKGALLGIKYHHERFDGRGYPEKLKGTEIPLVARIIAVTDSFDAMTSDRAYRKSIPLATAKEILIQEKNRQFDSEVVDRFLKILTI
ncbi:MAG: hypothetical protein A2252_05125 [Elusimicrobia bacterium RIFOXYA2_FULL_39_19]|nr:MAG: hypothetical protein A2252_05125 [Elusimicrobia bacterium RIFOXYA2_FULL_39_19]